MEITSETKTTIRRALVSILIGAIISAITQILEILLSLGREKVLDLFASGSGMLYYLKSRRVV